MSQADDGPALEELFAGLSVTADWTMGFLTAIGSGPDAVAEASWIPEILRDGVLDGKRVDLLGRLFGAVVETLSSRPEIIPPEPDKPAEDAVEFCRGYLHGARMHPAWRADASAVSKLAPFLALAKEEGAPDLDETTERERLGATVADLRAYWQSKRQFVRAAAKVGRNDPCSCGSGKKHKRCCAA